ncbi:MAG: response regulator transcription factor [Proteobacteria bacterium]|nr:response regulator transcription factor [Pseudomonadota bacterium]
MSSALKISHLNPDECNIVLVDDHPLITSGLSRLIVERGWSIAAELSDSSQLHEAVINLMPTVVIADIVMPGPDILETIAAIRLQNHQFKLIILSAYFSEINLSRALRVGADGIVSKTDGPDELLRCIEAVHSGQKFISESLNQHFSGNPYTGTLPKVSRGLLTPREIEVLCLLGKGKNIKKVGEALSIATKTVDRHRTNIMNKLNIHSQIDLVRFAIREKIIDA